jgi:hypothetical protein
MRPFNFTDENLVVNSISFNIKGSIDLKPIANYLFQTFGFNSIIAKGSNTKTKSLIYRDKNEFQVSFRQYDYNPELKSC